LLTLLLSRNKVLTVLILVFLVTAYLIIHFDNIKNLISETKQSSIAPFDIKNQQTNACDNIDTIAPFSQDSISKDTINKDIY